MSSCARILIEKRMEKFNFPLIVYRTKCRHTHTHKKSTWGRLFRSFISFNLGSFYLSDDIFGENKTISSVKGNYILVSIMNRSTHHCIHTLCRKYVDVTFGLKFKPFSISFRRRLIFFSFPFFHHQHVFMLFYTI